MFGMKPIPSAIVVVAGVAAILFTGKAALDSGLIPKPAFMKAKVPDKIALFSGAVNDKPAQTYTLNAAPAGNVGTVRVLTLAWQAMGDLALANGGADTTPDSLVKQYAGCCVHIERQDDYGVMQTEMAKDPAVVSIIMGDALSSFTQGTKKLGQEVAVFDIVGFSHGEDKCMLPSKNPTAARGALVAAVPRDGDWNVCVKWASDNGVPINTDNTVYDPDALNFMDTDSFTAADDKFIAGACEDRIVAHNGIKTKETKHICVTGVATWTPGDVTVAKKRGGVVTVASTADYNQQMPAVLIGNKKWLADHKDFVVGLIKAIDRANVEVRTNNKLHQMAVAEAEIFGKGGGDDANPAYWAKYFVGVNDTDKTGATINLGGSRLIGLAEARDYLGMNPGSLDIYKGVYETFGKYYHDFYPTLVPSFEKYENVVDKTYIAAALDGVVMTAPATSTFTQTKDISNVVSKKAYAIEFATGKATISPKSRAVLEDIANQSSMTNLRIEISGHTDNTGSSDANLALSQARADAVKQYLNRLAPNTFPLARMQAHGFGDQKPVGDNDTEAGRQKNRRVEIVLGN